MDHGQPVDWMQPSGLLLTAASVWSINCYSHLEDDLTTRKYLAQKLYYLCLRKAPDIKHCWCQAAGYPGAKIFTSGATIINGAPTNQALIYLCGPSVGPQADHWLVSA